MEAYAYSNFVCKNERPDKTDFTLYLGDLTTHTVEINIVIGTLLSECVCVCVCERLCRNLPVRKAATSETAVLETVGTLSERSSPI